MIVAPFGDRALELDLGTTGDEPRDARRARRVARAIEAARIAGVRECVSAYGTVLVHLSRLHDAAARGEVQRAVEAIAAAPDAPEDEQARGPLHVIRAIYDGPDLGAVAAASGLSLEGVARAHASRVYEVEVIGFLPGFAYLGRLDPELVVPRLHTPRPRVPAGSIGIAGARTGIYPLDSPGGWRLLGRAVDFVPFDPFAPEGDPPARLVPGDRVRFEIEDVAGRH
jgi:KipI family sensor histidine kinase inhibitor